MSGFNLIQTGNDRPDEILSGSVIMAILLKSTQFLQTPVNSQFTIFQNLRNETQLLSNNMVHSILLAISTNVTNLSIKFW